MKDILLSPSKKNRWYNQGIRREKVKGDTADPSLSVGPNPFGSSTSPKNCNASTFASWLAHKFGPPPLEATFSDVRIDPKCEAFIEFAGPLEPREEVQKEYDAVRNEILEQSKGKARKPKTAKHQSHPKEPKRQRTNGGSCSAPRYSFPDLNLPAPESPTEPFDDGRQDLDPAGAVSAATDREQLKNQLNADAAMWEGHFPSAFAIAQQDDDGDQEQHGRL